MTLNIDPSCTAAPADRESLSDGASQKVTGYALPHAGTPVARQAGASVADFLAWMLLAVIVASAIFEATTSSIRTPRTTRKLRTSPSSSRGPSSSGT